MLLHELSVQDGKLVASAANGIRTVINNYGDLLPWLEECDDPLPCFWDLDANAALLLKLLPPDDRDAAISAGKYTRNIITYNGQGQATGRFFILYIPKRVLFIGGKRNVSYYGLSGFFDYDYRYNKAPPLQEQQRLGEQMISELMRVGIHPKRLTSHAALIDFMFEEINLPTHLDCPPEVNQIAWDCCGRAWVEAHKLGYWRQAYTYDIISSFPSELSLLYDLRHGTFVHEKRYRSDALYGWLVMDYNITDDVIPFTYDWPGGIYNTKGTYRDVTTKALYDVAIAHNKYIGEIQDAWWWVPYNTPNQPLNKAMQYLYHSRKVSPVLNSLLKTGMAACYGQFLATLENGTKAGAHFNPVWASIVEDGIKAKVYSFILDNHLEPYIIHIATDGVTLDRTIDRFVTPGDMGDWRYDGSGECLVLSTAAMFYRNRRPCQITLPQALKMIEADSAADEWTSSVPHRLMLGECLHDMSTIGNTIELSTSFGLPFEHDRNFIDLPHNGADILTHIYDSVAWKK
jgi:hypothetical protein